MGPKTVRLIGNHPEEKMNRKSMIVMIALLGLSAIAGAQTPPVDVTGVWAVVFETPMGERTYMTSFVQEKDVLQVVMKSPQGTEMKTTGKIKGNELEWTVVLSGPMGEISLAFKGKVEGEAMTGTVQMGEAGEAAFKAKKEK
jgi:hypothetical protein